MTKALYPGSFDPLTFGHLDIIERSANIYDEVVVGVLNNSEKKSLFTVEERVEMAKRLTTKYDNVTVASFDGLMVDYAKSIDTKVVIRGLRAITDFDYELQIAQTNKAQYPELETVFMTTALNFSYLSSSIVKEFASYGGDISKFVPKEIIPLIEAKYQA